MHDSIENLIKQIGYNKEQIGYYLGSCLDEYPEATRTKWQHYAVLIVKSMDKSSNEMLLTAFENQLRDCLLHEPVIAYNVGDYLSIFILLTAINKLLLGYKPFDAMNFASSVVGRNRLENYMDKGLVL